QLLIHIPEPRTISTVSRPPSPPLSRTSLGLFNISNTSPTHAAQVCSTSQTPLIQLATPWRANVAERKGAVSDEDRTPRLRWR
ncbi:hypothetical protein PIB30_059827, partial [Stylosanthes scabra]|nr:hypothetical protein [Stylosanthes scabra]